MHNSAGLECRSGVPAWSAGLALDPCDGAAVGSIPRSFLWAMARICVATATRHALVIVLSTTTP